MSDIKKLSSGDTVQANILMMSFYLCWQHILNLPFSHIYNCLAVLHFTHLLSEHNYAIQGNIRDWSQIHTHRPQKADWISRSDC